MRENPQSQVFVAKSLYRQVFCPMLWGALVRQRLAKIVKHYTPSSQAVRATHLPELPSPTSYLYNNFMFML